MDLGLFNEFIEWIDTFNRWMMYLVINAKSITYTPSEGSVDFSLCWVKNTLWFHVFTREAVSTLHQRPRFSFFFFFEGPVIQMLKQLSEEKKLRSIHYIDWAHLLRQSCYMGMTLRQCRRLILLKITAISVLLIHVTPSRVINVHFGLSVLQFRDTLWFPVYHEPKRRMDRQKRRE